MNAEEVGYALLLSVPPGVGVVGFAAHVIARDPLEPLALAAGLITTVAIFSFVVLLVVTGSSDDSDVPSD